MSEAEIKALIADQTIHQLHQPPPPIINNIQTLTQEAETAINEAINEATRITGNINLDHISEQRQKELDAYTRLDDILEPNIKARMHCIMAHRMDLSNTADNIIFLGKAPDLKMTRKQRRQNGCDFEACIRMKSKLPSTSRNK